jgi:hypothetical protein
MSDIVERLRRGIYPDETGFASTEDTMREAADEIKRLRGECTRWSELRDADIKRLRTELELCDDEIERLREALRICDEAITGHLCFAWSAAEAAVQLRAARMKARDALKAEGGP